MFDEKVKFQALFPEDKENSELMVDAKAKNQSGLEEREKSNDDFRYSKMSETQAANLYEERFPLNIKLRFNLNFQNDSAYDKICKQSSF